MKIGQSQDTPFFYKNYITQNWALWFLENHQKCPSNILKWFLIYDSKRTLNGPLNQRNASFLRVLQQNEKDRIFGTKFMEYDGFTIFF